MGVLPDCAGRGKRRAGAPAVRMLPRRRPDSGARLIRHGYRGARYSFGFPACPGLEDQAQLLAPVSAPAVGIRLGEEAQLDPEQSISALVLHHPRARYFTTCSGTGAAGARTSPPRAVLHDIALAPLAAPA